MLKRIFISTFITLCLAGMVKAQPVMSVKAMQEYKNDSLEKARSLIDSAVTLDIGKDDAWSWQVRGFVYKSLFKENRTDQSFRETGVESFEKALKLTDDQKIVDNSKKGIRYFAHTYYNDGVRKMDTANYKQALKDYERYKKTFRIAQPSKDFTKKDIQFYNTLAGIHQTILENHPNPSEKLYDNAIESYKKVLEYSPDNYRANYNIGIIFYNRGVETVKNMNVDEMDLLMLKKKQKECVNMFKEALPFMKKAYELKPKNKETLEGLSGIYYQLNEKEKSQHYDKLRQNLNGSEDGEEKNKKKGSGNGGQ